MAGACAIVSSSRHGRCGRCPTDGRSALKSGETRSPYFYGGQLVIPASDWFRPGSAILCTISARRSPRRSRPGHRTGGRPGGNRIPWAGPFVGTAGTGFDSISPPGRL